MQKCIFRPQTQSLMVTHAIDSCYTFGMSSAASKAHSADPFRADRIAALKGPYRRTRGPTFRPAPSASAQLEEIIRTFQRKTFSGTREQVSAAQLGLFNEAEEIEAAAALEVSIKPHTRQRRGRPALPPELPREEVISRPGRERQGLPTTMARHWTQIGEETSEQLDIIPASVKVIRHVRLKYALPLLPAACGHGQPSRPSRWASPSQHPVCWPTSHGQVCRCLAAVSSDPTVSRDWGLNSTAPHWPTGWSSAAAGSAPDQSPEPSRSSTNRSSAWTRPQFRCSMNRASRPKVPVTCGSMGAGPPGQRVLVYHYEASRSGNVPLERLEGFEGALMADGYSGYGVAPPPVEPMASLAWDAGPCPDASSSMPPSSSPKGKTGRPDQALAMINKLYLIERQARDLDPLQRHQLRQGQARRLSTQLQAWLTKTLPRVAPKTKLGQALHYLQAQWITLVRYLDDGRYPSITMLSKTPSDPSPLAGRTGCSQSHRPALTPAPTFTA